MKVDILSNGIKHRQDVEPINIPKEYEHIKPVRAFPKAGRRKDSSTAEYHRLRRQGYIMQLNIEYSVEQVKRKDPERKFLYLHECYYSAVGIKSKEITLGVIMGRSGIDPKETAKYRENALQELRKYPGFEVALPTGTKEKVEIKEEELTEEEAFQ